MEFSDFGFKNILLKNCETLDFKEPTPIQKKAIPIILNGSDLIGCAETGTGKTAAFLLPTLQKLILENKAGVKALIVAPTRELVSQIEKAYIDLAPNNVRCVSIIGGASMNKQINKLRRGVNVVIATPGRLNDHIKRGTINLGNVDTLILDEADRMLDMGFLPQIRDILTVIPKQRQNLLFSATMSDSIKSLAYSIMELPKVVEVSRQNRTARTVKQTVYPVATHSKTALLLNLLEENEYDKILVFTRTKRGADRITHILKKREMSANSIHSNRTQSQREKALKSFKAGNTRVLVATDIASRGIDVDQVSHVINYDIPESPEDYVHRVGRTGRAGNRGQAITLVTPNDELAMRAIEKLTEQKVKRVVLDEFGGTMTIPSSVFKKKKSNPSTRSRTKKSTRRRRRR